MSFLELALVTKSFNKIQVVHGFDFSAKRGEFVSFLGPSGCGKTTVLRMIAGFEEVTTGSISIDGKDVTKLPANKRNIGMVFQSYALFPNMTVAQNIGFGLKIVGQSQELIKSRVREMLELIKLPQLADRYPFQLSGGQQQRVALARAVATKPQMLLLDEPLSALDAKIRVSLRDDIRTMQLHLGITTIFVTHDQEEALSLSDRIVVMSDGRIEQIGTPFEIYNFPATPFVASFIGMLNQLSVKVIDPQSGSLDLFGQKFSTARGLINSHAGQMIKVALRPEALTLGDALDSKQNQLIGNVENVQFLGSVIRVKVRIGQEMLSADTFNSVGVTPPKIGERVGLAFAKHDVLILQPS